MNRAQLVNIYRRLAKTRTNYAECIKITRRDGTAYRFTTHDRNLQIKESDGQRYTYDYADGFTMTALENSDGLVVTNMDLEAALSDDAISADDIKAGLFNNARIELFIAFWKNTQVGTLPLRLGWFGEITAQGVEYRVDIRGIAQKLQVMFIQTTSLECRFSFCDAKCGLNAADFTESVTVSEVISKDTFRVSGMSGANEGKYKWGLATWTSGNNEDVSMEILHNFENKLNLFLPMPYVIEVGDTIDIVQGCDKRWVTCKEQYDNARYFGGEPFLAGSDVLRKAPETEGGNSGILGSQLTGIVNRITSNNDD